MQQTCFHTVATVFDSVTRMFQRFKELAQKTQQENYPGEAIDGAIFSREVMYPALIGIGLLILLGFLLF